MQRRSVLQSAALGAGIAVAGCLGFGDDDTVLDPPDRDFDVDPEALAYPAYGQELPEATLPSPLHDREVSTREYVGERETLLTFVFTRCPGPCPALTASLAQAQVTAADGGYSGEVAFMPVTFDPEYDTTERLREFSEINGADPTAENWQFLRPETPERAREVVGEREMFGVGFEEVPVDESAHGDHEGEDDQDGEDDETHSDGDHDDHEGDGTDEDQGEVLEPEESQETTFAHTNLLLLVNRDGYVERAYSPDPPRPDIVIDDLEAVREGYE